MSSLAAQRRVIVPSLKPRMSEISPNFTRPMVEATATLARALDLHYASSMSALRTLPSSQYYLGTSIPLPGHASTPTPASAGLNTACLLALPYSSLLGASQVPSTLALPSTDESIASQIHVYAYHVCLH